jgi:Fic family protein
MGRMDSLYVKRDRSDRSAHDTYRKKIKQLMQEYKLNIREHFNFYSQDLLNNLFSHPYTKIEFLERDLKTTRLTATKYLDKLSEASYLEKHKIWRSNYYINRRLFDLLSNKPLN